MPNCTNQTQPLYRLSHIPICLRADFTLSYFIVVKWTTAPYQSLECCPIEPYIMNPYPVACEWMKKKKRKNVQLLRRGRVQQSSELLFWRSASIDLHLHCEPFAGGGGGVKLRGYILGENDHEHHGANFREWWTNSSENLCTGGKLTRGEWLRCHIGDGWARNDRKSQVAGWSPAARLFLSQQRNCRKRKSVILKIFVSDHFSYCS